MSKDLELFQRMIYVNTIMAIQEGAISSSDGKKILSMVELVNKIMANKELLCYTSKVYSANKEHIESLKQSILDKIKAADKASAKYAKEKTRIIIDLGL